MGETTGVFLYPVQRPQPGNRATLPTRWAFPAAEPTSTGALDAIGGNFWEMAAMPRIFRYSTRHIATIGDDRRVVTAGPQIAPDLPTLDQARPRLRLFAECRSVRCEAAR